MEGNMSVQDTGRWNDREKLHRRSKLEICLDVLRIVEKGVKKPTKIMYGANISWVPVKQILRLMVSEGFIREIESKRDKRTIRYYEITQSGLNVLKYLDEEKDLLRLIESTHSK